jgi:hypothetical protein
VKPRATGNPRPSDLKIRKLCHAGGLLCIIFGLLLFLTAAGGFTAEQKTLEVQTAPKPIPVEEIATRSAEVADLLRTLHAQFTPNPEFEKIQKELPEASSRMADELRRTLKVLHAQPTLEMLQNQQQLWKKNQSELVAWLNLLTRRATHLQAAMRQLGGLYESWHQTLDAAQKAQAPETVIQQIDAILPDIKAARKNLQVKHSAAIDLQSRVAEEVARCGAALGEISKAQQAVVEKIASRESRPIWHEDLWTQARAQRFTWLRDIAIDPLSYPDRRLCDWNGAAWSRFDKSDCFARRFRGGYRLWTPKRGQQLRLRADTSIGAADSPGRHRRIEQPPGTGATDRHSRQHCPYPAGG